MQHNKSTIASGVITSAGVIMLLFPSTAIMGFLLICVGWGLVALDA